MGVANLVGLLTLRNVGNYYQTIRYDVPEDNNTAVRTLNVAPPLPMECESRHMSVAYEYCSNSCRAVGTVYCSNSCRAQRFCVAETPTELRYMCRYECVAYLSILISVLFFRESRGTQADP